MTIEQYYMNPENVAGKVFVARSRPYREVSAEEFYGLVEPEQEGADLLMKRVFCNDGFNMSVQAGSALYSAPRVTLRSKYTCFYREFEVGFPSEKEDLLMPYAEDEDKPTETVYAYVPIEVVNKVIEKHGGIQPVSPDQKDV
jgi:hypothetical protein